MASFKLPFATQPKELEVVRVGNDEVGSIDIKKMKDLSPNERLFIRGLTKDLPDLRELAVKLAEEIAEKNGDTLVAVYNALTAGDTDYLSENLGQVIEFQKAMETYTEARTLALACAMVKFRVKGCDSCTLEDIGNADLVRPELVKLIADFAAKEENGWSEEAAPAPTEDDLKKSQSESKTEKVATK